MRITTPFGFHSTASEVAHGVDLSGRQAIVTGGASGIGIETARALAEAGAMVTLAVRRPEAAESVATELRAGGHSIHVKRLDVADIASINAFASDWKGPLDVLVNNAGIMALPDLTLTPEGWELKYATNFLGHFALTQRLHNALASALGARIVWLSSNAHLLEPVVFDDLHFNFRAYDPRVAYAQSKCACILAAIEFTRRWSNEGILANALNPGAIATHLQKHTGGLKTPPERRKSPQQGAATSVLLAVSPLLSGIGGRYFEDCNEAPVVLKRPADFTGVAPDAIDRDNAARLWDVATAQLGESSTQARGFNY